MRVSALGSNRRHSGDRMLLVLLAVLLVMGLIVMYSISPALISPKGTNPVSYYVGRQVASIFIGLVLLVLCSRLRLDWLRNISYVLLGLSFVLSVIVTVKGGIGNRWLQVGGISFQPAELAKLAMIMYLSYFLAIKQRMRVLANYKMTMQPIAIMLGIATFLVVVLQRDLGSMMVLIAIAAAMSYVAGMPLKKIGLAALAVVLIASVAVAATPYRRDRLANFFYPERDCGNSGYHVCQALITIGSGGVAGVSLGKSIQAHGYLPEPATDSIFAIFAENFGFMGTLVLMAVIGFMLLRFLSLIDRADTSENRLIMVGIFAWLAVQSIMNMGAMMGILPLKGITLPFISYGGSSIMLLMAALGVAYNVSRYSLARKQLNYEVQNAEPTENIVGRWRNSRAYKPHVVRRRSD